MPITSLIEGPPSIRPEPTPAADTKKEDRRSGPLSWLSL